jgi:hypothetical protein
MPGDELLEYICNENDADQASAVTSNPANGGHPKTGQ